MTETILENVVIPNWDAPDHIRALTTTRMTQINGECGMSVGSYGTEQGSNGLNIATHVGDDPDAVAHNRQLLRQILSDEPLWLNQTHGVEIVSQLSDELCPEADAVLLTEPNQVGVIMTADCLPVLFTTDQGDMVAGAHAGWRGLLAGVLEKTVAAMVQTSAQAKHIQVWLGPAIGPEQFEVGAEVFEAFMEHARQSGLDIERTQQCFQSKPAFSNEAQKYLADIYALARLRLQSAGVPLENISGGEYCTFTDATRFYSYRRDGVTGRMASLIWMQD